MRERKAHPKTRKIIPKSIINRYEFHVRKSDAKNWKVLRNDTQKEAKTHSRNGNGSQQNGPWNNVEIKDVDRTGPGWGRGIFAPNPRGPLGPIY